MNLIQRAKYHWHCYWYSLNEQLLQDCQDDYEKVLIHSKVIYHRQKMQSI